MPHSGDLSWDTIFLDNVCAAVHLMICIFFSLRNTQHATDFLLKDRILLSRVLLSPAGELCQFLSITNFCHKFWFGKLNLKTTDKHTSLRGKTPVSVDPNKGSFFLKTMLLFNFLNGLGTRPLHHPELSIWASLPRIIFIDCHYPVLTPIPCVASFWKKFSIQIKYNKQMATWNVCQAVFIISLGDADTLFDMFIKR